MEKGKLKKVKGKLKNNDKDISIVIVPHFSGKVKTLRLNKLYSGIILAAAVLFIGTAIFSFGYASAKSTENRQLKSNVTQLMDVNSLQLDVISSKDSKINMLNSKDKTVKKLMSDFLSKYKNMTNRYLTNRSDSVSLRRSGASMDKAFVNDLKVLKNTIIKLRRMSDSSIKSTGTMNDVENKIDHYLAALPTSWPAHGGITSAFGGRTDPISYSHRYHDGMDIGASYGAPITAPGNGTVVFAGYDGAYGSEIMISHGYGITTMYGHCSAMYVHVGEKVKRGETIGRVGSSGRSTGPHLHYRVTINGTPVNPLKFLN